MKKQRKTTSLVNPFDRWRQFFPLVIVILTLVIYLRALPYEFIYNWDDAGYVLKNDDIKACSWTNLVKIFTNFYMSNYHPLTMLSYMLDYALVGEQSWWYHLVNILFHILNSLLVYKFIRKLTDSPFVAFGTALIFALHPMHVESVAWISERKDVLYVFFFLLGLNAYLSYQNERKLGKYIIISIYFLLSLFSKSAAVVFPVICLILDWYKKEKFTLRLLLEKIPWFALSIFFGILAIYSQDKAIQNLRGQMYWWEQLFIVNYGMLLYLLKFFIPHKFSAFHPYPIKTGEFFPTYVYALILITITLAVLWFKYGRKNRLLTAGLFFFFAAIAPMMQLIPVGGAMIAERYTYLAYIGLSIPLFAWIQEKIITNKKWLMYFVSVWLVGLAIQTFDRISYWENGDVLFSDVIKKYPLNAYSWTNRGFLYWDYYALKKYKNNEVKKNYYVEKAYQDFTHAIQIDTTFSQAYVDRAILLYNTGRPEAALHDFNKLLALQPDHKDGLLGRANTLSSLGKYAEAIPDYSKYLQLNPADAKAKLWRAIAYVKTQQLDKAFLDLYESKKMNPSDYEVYYWLGLAHYHSNRMDSAVHYFRQVEKMKPDFAEVLDWEALAYQQMHDYENALSCFNRAIELNPNNCVSLVNRAALLFGLKKFQQAYEDIQSAKQKGCFIPPALMTDIEHFYKK